VRKNIFAILFLAICPLLFAQQALNNDSVIKLVKAGLSEDLIVSTINAQAGTYDTSTDGIIALKTAGISDKVVAAIVARAAGSQISPTQRGAVVDNLTAAYKQYRNSVVTVLAEYGPAKGTGFIVDKTGLVITNQHVVSRSEWVAVQVDDHIRLRAEVLATDPEKDVAVLWVNLANAPHIEPVVLLKSGDTPAEEGERVFTIGSPLHQSKVMTTGIVSKVENRAIISDLNINHGNSGGPLFNSQGVVIGVTTFNDLSDRGGAGIAGVVRIEQALPLLDIARGKQATSAKPSPELLQIEPTDRFPIEALKESASVKKFKNYLYVFDVGDYDLAVITPVFKYRKLAARVEAARQKDKRNRKSTAAQGTFEPLDDLKGWEEYTGEYDPTLLIQATPKLVEGFWSAFGRGMAASHGYAPGPASMHFKTDFYKMRLFCGDREILPIWPGKAEHVLTVNNEAVRVTDATFDGLYEFAFDAIRPDCDTVSLRIYSEKNPNKPKVKELEKETIDAVYRDFAPYRVQEGVK
jgi:S1-C subfamily serine protease